MKKFLLLSVLVSFVVSGCGYTLQSRSNLPFQEVDLGRIENRTHEPKLEDRLARAFGLVLPEYGIDLSKGARYRIEADITKFDLVALSELSLYVAEYQVTAVTTARLIDRQTNTVTSITSSGPFVTYFRSTGGIESVLANKELATDRAMRDIAQDIVQRIIYRKYLPEGKAPEAKKAEPPK